MNITLPEIINAIADAVIQKILESPSADHVLERLRDEFEKDQSEFKHEIIGRLSQASFHLASEIKESFQPKVMKNIERLLYDQLLREMRIEIERHQKELLTRIEMTLRDLDKIIDEKIKQHLTSTT